MIDDAPAGWELEPTDYRQLARHRHGDVLAVCYLYSHPDRAWAECTLCGAVVLDLARNEGVDGAIPSR